jgi:dCTP deaminase
MLLKADEIAKLLQVRDRPAGPLVIRPLVDLKHLSESGAAAIDLRLGRWFLSFRQSGQGMIKISDAIGARAQSKLTKSHFVPYGKSYILHPRAFVLGATLEWITLPADLAAYVVGRSSWGRRGLIIATATGVHPGFTGCLTLEITNVGEMPIEIRPGMSICQLFVHKVESNSPARDQSRFIGLRRPTLGTITPDRVANVLAGLIGHDKPPASS